MKRVMTSALVLSLLAGSAAFAQDQQGEGRRGGQRQERTAPPQADAGQRAERQDRGGGGNWQGRQPRAEQPQAQPQTQAQPQAERQQRDDRQGGVDQNRAGQIRAAQERAAQERAAQERAAQERAAQDQNRDDRPDNRQGGNRGQWNGQRDDNRGQRPDQRNDRGQWSSQGRGDDRGQWNGQRNDNRNAWNWQRPNNQQFRDRDRGRQQFDQRRYQSVYRFNQRYRLPAWRPPIGFYAYNWAYGDLLPRSWYSTTYYLDWFRYGLPMPPVGAEWVRAGDDAILVDTWTGRVLSVAYDLFW